MPDACCASVLNSVSTGVSEAYLRGTELDPDSSPMTSDCTLGCRIQKATSMSILQ
ncbi:hypothetical protein LIA77_11467 [Sarocladium implicatum]|nr:hypothetical protein LIA77_11467 [Sarocladium implicatum]